MQPIFSDNLLSHYISDFRLSSVTNIRRITLLIKGLVEELESGKIISSKEEEIKSRFLNYFFGDILGFNYGNSRKWQLREEKKSVVDGTKPDAALGYFFVDYTCDDVRAVIEIKSANIDLDEKQSRPDKQTPVDQAFGYASKTGGKCKWVIVSNIKEIRFYPSLDRAKCQVFFLKDLVNENKLKELLFLFHKDKFIKEFEKSSTDKLFEQVKVIQLKDDKPIHIIDKIYNNLKRFEAFGFVDPNYITTIFPFNILEKHVWHYHDRNLFTINHEVYELMKGVNIENEQVTFTDELQQEFTSSNVIDAKHKVEWSFLFLNHSLIDEISAIKDYKQVEERNKRTIGFSHRHRFHFKEGEEGITKNIRLIKDKTCDCISCNYRSLDFNRLLSKLKAGEGNENYNTSEYAYGNYLTASNNFKTTYNIYKAIEREVKGKQGKGVEYFLIKQNIKLLHNLALDYQFEDKQTIMDDIKSVDLDKVIYDEIEFDVDKDVKKYLIDIKENILIYKIQDEIEEITFKIEKLKILYENGGKQFSGPNLPNNLEHQYFLLYLHINSNYIIYDTFIRYKALTEKVFKGLVTSYQISECGIKSFNEFFLTEAILHVSPSSLQEILRKVENLKVMDDGTEKLLEKLNNFTTSVFKEGLFSDPYENTLISEQLNNHRFKYKFKNIFANLFIVLSRLEILKEDFNNCINPLIKFLKIEKELAWFDLKEFANFILRKGNLFEEKDLMEILKISVNRDKYGNNKYTDLIKTIPKALIKFYPAYKIDNAKLVKTAILNCSSDNGNNASYMYLVYLVNACNDNCKQILFSTFENYLDEKFSSEFYESLIRNSNFDYNLKNYFQIYSEITNQHKGGGAYKFGKLELTDLVFINYIFIIYKLNIDFKRIELKVFTNLNEFETWLLNPLEFDYKKFKAIWLTDLKDKIILDRLKGNLNITKAINKQLKREFNPILAEIKYKYFNKIKT
ncbi:hypothetical protein [Polaribacter sp.]|uniref:hypothetical protein n=2 Tax=Flavobacteriaceae TaxID=49546 RepID=UPI004047D0B5